VVVTVMTCDDSPHGARRSRPPSVVFFHATTVAQEGRWGQELGPCRCVLRPLARPARRLTLRAAASPTVENRTGMAASPAHLRRQAVLRRVACSLLATRCRDPRCVWQTHQTLTVRSADAGNSSSGSSWREQTPCSAA
jgi:hypothetical protein